MIQYSVKQLAQLAGISVRTLHLYDQLGLLKPNIRTVARYRLYGEKELLRLQQILFYKELDFPLQEIGKILDDPDFDLVEALLSHKNALEIRRDRIGTLLTTLDRTISKLKGGHMLTHEELYEGLPKEQAQAYRKEAIEKYGKETVEHSENALRQLTKDQYAQLSTESEAIRRELALMINEDPKSAQVQALIARHYENIRMFWGTAHTSDKQAEAYKGLGQLYVDDERFTIIDGKPNPVYARFMCKAMAYFAETHLK